MNRAWLVLVGWLVGCGPVPKDPCRENPSACDVDAGDLDAGVVDAGDMDASLDAGLVELDWRTVRGPPLTPHVVGEYQGTAVGLSENTFVVQSSCDAGACALSFHDDAGAVFNVLPHARGVFDFDVSPEGTQVLLLEPSAEGRCSDAEGFGTTWYEGTLSLVSLRDGARRWTLPGLTTAEFTGAGFLRHSGHLRVPRFDPVQCAPSSMEWRATRAPFLPPADVGAASYLEDELPDGRLLVHSRPETLSVHGTTIEHVSAEATTYFSSGDYVHALARYPVERSTSLGLKSHRRWELDVSGEGLYPDQASHRFVSLCEQSGLPTACVVLDGEGALPRAAISLGRVGGRKQLAIAGREDFAVFVNGASEVMRVDLRTGVAAQLPLPAGRLMAVGDGRGVVLRTLDRAWAIERDQVIAFEGRLVDVLSAEALGSDPSLPQAQLVFVVTSNESGGALWLNAWHVASRRIVKLTTKLNFNPPFRAPFTAAADCAMPGFVRSGGGPEESAAQRVRLLHFTEFIPSAQSKLRVFVMPVDLSEPPSLFAELEPGQCAPPLASPSGARLWLPVSTPTGKVRAVFAAQ